MKKLICCICEREFDGFGNNPEPIDSSDKNCCDTCNRTVVLLERFRRLQYQFHLEEEGVKQLQDRKLIDDERIKELRRKIYQVG